MKNILMLSVMAVLSFNLQGQEAPNKTAANNYALAAKFSPTQLAKMVHSTEVNPHWLKNGNRFWYQYKTTQGSNYYMVDADNRSKTALFNNDKMAAWLTEITKDPYDGQHLPKFDFEFVKNETAIRFRVTATEMVAVKKDSLNNQGVQKDSVVKDSTKKLAAKDLKKPKKEKKVYHLEYRLGGNGLTLLSNEKEAEKDYKKWANIAPDSSIVLFSKEFNLYWMDKENFLKAVKNEKDSTVVEHQWTTDGEEEFGYGGGNRGDDNEEVEKKKKDRTSIYGHWTDNAQKFIFQKTDSRMIKDLWVINSVAKKRPTLETYKYHMPGELEYAKKELLVFDIPSKSHIKIALDTVAQQNISVYTRPTKPSSEDDDFKPRLILSKKGDLYFNVISRDRKKMDVRVANLETGAVKVLIEERMNTYIEDRDPVLIKNETELLHWSERDGWAHFYRYTSQGKLINRLTTGPFHSEALKGVNEKTGTVYFSAHGVQNGIDPYYQHLYAVPLSGGVPKILNAGDYTASTNPSNGHRYFVSNYSRVDSTPKSELRSETGALLMSLETADLSALFAAGYQFPETFKVKADDGITDIYGVLYKPFDFDENKQYPLLEYVYPGPQTEAVNKEFSVRMDRMDRMAQLGFIVATMGNRGGHPDRSKWYHNYGYGNLRDYGLADKKYVAEQLADRHAFIDLDRVGIFGHSGGGFMSTAAILVYPDFFKVAVSAAGNHDNSMYNSWWSETHHGVLEEMNDKGEVTYQYDIDKNQSLAANLKGQLLLVTGDIDNNVHPGATIRMANALIKANKRFDFKLLPGQRHGFGDMTEYSFWLRADHFSRHLLGVPATAIDIKEINKDIPQNK
jgi:dipeptidyl aminopeptidase/acylaminoacyl peptidase